jgi:molybdopterin synthase catalytic subunit
MAEMITVRVRAFAGLREALGTSSVAVSVAAGTDVAGLMAQLAVAYPDAGLPGRRLAVAVNRSYADRERVLQDGDEVALLPPVSGGSGKLFELTDRPLSLDEVAGRVAGADRGGVTLFAGTVRGITGRALTDCLEYEAYPEMAEATLAGIGAEVLARWPSTSAVAIVHRIGRLAVGELAVVVAVASGHRQDTFAACQYAIDRVKQIAPIWKREIGPDGSSWVEGPESLA